MEFKYLPHLKGINCTSSLVTAYILDLLQMETEASTLQQGVIYKQWKKLKK